MGDDAPVTTRCASCNAGVGDDGTSCEGCGARYHRDCAEAARICCAPDCKTVIKPPLPLGRRPRSRLPNLALGTAVLGLAVGGALWLAAGWDQAPLVLVLAAGAGLVGFVASRFFASLRRP